MKITTVITRELMLRLLMFLTSLTFYFNCYQAQSSIINKSESDFINEKKIKIGEVLFNDKTLSLNKTHSCASCHNPYKAYTDNKKASNGFNNEKLKRNTPTLYNVSLNDVFFWDGRESSLYEATLSPILESKEMNMTEKEIEIRINNSILYRELFGEINIKDKINISDVINSLVSFQESLTKENSDFDNFIKGDEQAISKSAKKGYVLFKGKAGCINCHEGKAFTDNSFHNIGVKTTDIGKAKNNSDEYYNMSFRVPTLKNISMTAPYMHNGSIETLEKVIDFYDRGGDVKYKNLSPDITRLDLSKIEKRQLVDFLKTLNDKF